MSDLTKGFTCECGKYEKYSVYVYAHWDVKLIFTCECGIKYSIIKGRATKQK